MKKKMFVKSVFFTINNIIRKQSLESTLADWLNIVFV